MIVYVTEMRTGPGRTPTVRVERHTMSPATGLWNWLRRRHVVTDVEVVGIYAAHIRNFEMTRSTNKPSTLRLSVEGRDLISYMTKEVTDVDDR